MNTQMIKVASQLSIADLKAEAIKMNECLEDFATDVLFALLGALESKVSEQEYVSFCDSL